MLAIGWLGSVLYLAGQGLLSMGRIRADHGFHLFVLVAATCLVASSAAIASWQAVGVNAFWAVVSAGSLLAGAAAQGRPVRPPGTVAVAACCTVLASVLVALDPRGFVSGLGWAGAALLCLSYLLLSRGRLSQAQYFAVSGAGAVALMPELLRDGNHPVLALEAAWAGFSAWGLLRLRLRPAPPAGG